MKCIKCGKEIPEGELFCVECSLNPIDVLLEDRPIPQRPMPKGQLQAPQKVRHAAPPAPAPKPAAAHHQSGLKAALWVVTMLLVLVGGYLVVQYGSIGAVKVKLWNKERDLAVRESELSTLQAMVEDLQSQLDALNLTLEAKNKELDTLAQQLSGSQSDQSQTSYDLTTKEAELDRLTEENRQLSDVADQLEAEVEALTQKLSEREEALSAAAIYKTKSDFMDSYVVFVENNGSGVYHTYDCKDFSRTSFWAYSRKLAESNGYQPCTTCGGKP